MFALCPRVASAQTGLAGDANGDLKVDGVDYIAWLNHYNTQNTSGASVGDFNNDGIIDGVDYIVWLTHYGQTATPTPLPTATQTTTPTPTTSSGPTATPALSSSYVYPLKVSSNNRYLVDQNNQPVFWNGDTPWSLIVQVSKADADFYLNNRQAKGFNVILVNLIEHQFASNAPRNFYGDAPFTGAAFATPNEAYFAHADYVISGAVQRGITVLLDPLYLGYGCGNEGWCSDVQAASATTMQNWGMYVGNRYKNYDNIVWVIGGDTDPSQVKSKVSAFVTGLTATDTRHLITAHNSPNSMAVSPWSGATWLSVNNVYTYDPTYSLSEDAYLYSPTKPFFMVESTYENEHGVNTQRVRAQAYWAVLSGAFGHLLGSCPMWNLGSLNAAGFCDVGGVNWKTQLDSTASVSMTHFKNVFQTRAWYSLVPDFNHTVVTSGYGTSGSTTYVTTARTADGKLIISYFPSVKTITVDMTKLSGAVTAKWYDPANGVYATISGSPFANTGTRQFTPNGNNSGGAGDWVLVLEGN